MLLLLLAIKIRCLKEPLLCFTYNLLKKVRQDLNVLVGYKYLYDIIRSEYVNLILKNK